MANPDEEGHSLQALAKARRLRITKWWSYPIRSRLEKRGMNNLWTCFHSVERILDPAVSELREIQISQV